MKKYFEIKEAAKTEGLSARRIQMRVLDAIKADGYVDKDLFLTEEGKEIARNVIPETYRG